MKKRVISLLLTLCLVSSMPTTPVYAEAAVQEVQTQNSGGALNPQGSTDVDSSQKESTEEEKEDSEEKKESTESDKVQSLQELINALPDAENITEENSEDVTTRLEAINEAKEELSEEENTQVDYTRYDAAVAKLLELAGEQGAAEPMMVDSDDTTGGFQIMGGTYDTDYTFNDGVLTIKTDTDMTISSTGDKTDFRICIAEGITANLTFNGVKIQSDQDALTLEQNATLNLKLTGENSLVANTYRGIFMKENTKMIVNGDADGSLHVRGGNWVCPGIEMNKTAYFLIESGIVHATGGYYSEIKTDYSLKAGIYGGTVEAKGGYLQAESQLHYIDWTPCTVEAIAECDFKATGNAVVVAKYEGIKNFDPNAEGLSGFIVNGSNAYVYGEGQQLSYDVTVDETLTIPEGVTLTVKDGITLDVKGTLINNGKIINNGTINYAAIEGNGTIEGNNAILYGDGKIDLTQGRVEITDDYYTVGNQKYIYGNSFNGETFTIDGQDNTATGNTITVKKSCTLNLKNITIGKDSASTGGQTPMVIGPNISVGLHIEGTAYIGDGWDDYHTNNIAIGNKSSVTVEGGTLKCTENAFYSKVAMGENASMTVKSGEVDLRSSYAPAITGNGTFTVEGGNVKLRSDSLGGASQAICDGNVAFDIKNGTVEIYQTGNKFGGKSLSITGGKLTSGLTSFTLDQAFTLDGGIVELAGTIDDSVKKASTLTKGLVIDGNNVTVYGDYTLTDNFTLAAGKTLTIPADATLTVGEGSKLTNCGTIMVEKGGTLTIIGDAENTGDGKLQVEEGGTVNKKEQNQPFIWGFFYEATETTITFSSDSEKRNDVQYSLDAGESYQDSPEFVDLTPNRYYKFKVRYPENDYYKESQSDTRPVYTEINKNGLYVAFEDVSQGGYWLTDNNKLTTDGASETNYNVHYDPNTGRLTLRDFDITYKWSYTEASGMYDRSIAGIYAPIGVGQIKIEGDCSLKGDASIYVEKGQLEVSGTGSLECENAVRCYDGSADIQLDGRYMGAVGISIYSETADCHINIQASEIQANYIRCYNWSDSTVSLTSTQGNISLNGVEVSSHSGNSEIKISAKGNIISNYVQAWNNNETSVIELSVGAGHQAIFTADEHHRALNADKITFPEHAIITASTGVEGKDAAEWKSEDKDQYMYVKVENPCNLSVTNGSGSNYYKAGDTVTVQANAASSGKRFKDWSGLDVDGIEIISGSKTSATISFKMPKTDMKLTANYEDVPTSSSSSDEHHSDSNNNTATTTTTSTQTAAATTTTMQAASAGTASKSSTSANSSVADTASGESLTEDTVTSDEKVEEAAAEENTAEPQDENASDEVEIGKDITSANESESSGLLLWITLIIVAAGLLIILIYKRREKDEE